ncbi:hypothetical protein ABAZ39_05410 [Azospirillum argentinense]|uniref:Murein endopeptidase K n=1 Tax=Azospirillum argentinense TaxID=2970906 RepID=A0A060DL36_9PROT|nr:MULTISPECIES: DUF882 domain-containing protein [Azospirillum]AIB11459.1 hypothetical protein ABAZ39_05410 [Azospirillum argentinense]EZQ08378.1 membrane protein [Azospirillum argentinense]
MRIGLATAAAGMVMAPEVSEAALRAPPRQLVLLNLHTGERVRAEYWSKGRYQRDGLREINHLLRDHRTGAVHPIDPKLLDLLHALTRKVGGKTPVHIISGYRSPESNAWLREQDGSGVAQNSFHMQGKAIDLRVPGLPLRTLQRAALSLRGGGVGYYPDSNFVHVDVGPKRQWAS